MMKRTVIGVCGFVLLSAISIPAFADQSIGYQEYFNEGVKALKEHDDQKALRCFKIAQIYDPADQEVSKYIGILEKKGESVELPPAQLPAQESVGYKYYLSKGIEAFQQHEINKAIHYFNVALIFNPDSTEADQYLHDLSQPIAFLKENQVQAQQQQAPIEQPQASSSPAEWPQPSPAVVAPPAPVYVASLHPKQAPQEISLLQMAKSGIKKPTLEIELNSSVILDGSNIQRLLVVDEGFIRIKTIGNDRLEIDAVGIGTTFLHIWDNSGRHTLYIEVVFPHVVVYGAAQEMNGVYHSQPFIFTYSNDWNTYYNGKNIPDLKRQSYEFDQLLSVKGETPYGFFDASGSYSDYGSFSEVDSYTIGLSQIPLEGTSNFNLRGFDALRYLSPLTMPSVRLRGAFADIDFLDNNLGLSVSHGQAQQTLGFIPLGGDQFPDSYIDAVKLTLFPTSNNDQYSFNYATSYGPDRLPYLTDHVYSAEEQHKFNDFLTFNAEQGSDSSHESQLASLKWEEGGFKSGLNFRNVDKDYSTISSLPADQGETGAMWTTDAEYQNFTASSFFEAYQDHLYSNPDDPRALNYDANGHIKMNISPDVWTDSDANYVDNAGELSPSRSFGFNQRISKSFGIWRSMKGIVYGGAGYQNSHSTGSDISDFDLEDVLAGIQLPLTRQVSAFASYQYDWLDQPVNGRTNPGIVDTGIQYQRQITPRLTFTSQLSFHDELGVASSNSGVLSGEESVIITSGFNYNPTPDINFFGDCNASKVLSHLGDPSYDDFEAHLGVRLTFGGSMYWDPLGTVTGIVFKDRNGNGKFSSGDEGIPGVKLKVGDKVAETDKYGRYRIQVRARAVDVTPVMDTVPGGLIFSTPQTLNIKVVQGRVSHADFGLIIQTGIYGLVFVDKNGSGVPNEGDKFIGKVKVVLDGNIIEHSDTHGAFYFRNVPPGKHTISIDINSLSINMVPLLKLKNEIDVAEGTNYMFNIPVKIEKAEGDQE